jgi:hypothetical protein
MKLAKVTRTLSTPGCLAGCLYSRQEQCEQQPNDADDNQKLDQRDTEPEMLFDLIVATAWRLQHDGYCLTGEVRSKGSGSGRSNPSKFERVC